MNIYKPEKKQCIAPCKHKKCECGHCKDYHMHNYEACQQLSRETLMQCECGRFTQDK